MYREHDVIPWATSNLTMDPASRLSCTDMFNNYKAWGGRSARRVFIENMALRADYRLLRIAGKPTRGFKGVRLCRSVGNFTGPLAVARQLLDAAAERYGIQDLNKIGDLLLTIGRPWSLRTALELCSEYAAIYPELEQVSALITLKS